MLRKITLISTIFLLFNYCGLNNTVVIELDKAINGNKSEICFNQINEDFDSLMILRPYSDVTKLATKVTIDLNQIEKTNIEKRDDISVFVFLKKRQVEHVIKVNTNKYLIQVDASKIYSKDHTFKLKKGTGLLEGFVFVSE